MPFKIQTLKKSTWEDCWVYPTPKNYSEWIAEFKSLSEEIPDEKFRLVRYVLDVRLESGRDV